MATSKALKYDIVNFVDDIFSKAISFGASDIHIEPLDKKIIVRYRIDGILRVVLEEDFYFYEPMIARIKILAELETTGLPRPQEGKIKFSHQGNQVDLRVSIFPTCYGENIVIRLLESIKVYKEFTDLGFDSQQAKQLETIIKKPYGLILVTGPNGSGKSTTLFSVLDKLNEPGKCLVTLEDPIERKLEMIRQTQIEPKINLDFASGLRYLLRQDPDIIMVGEIRDKETAQIAVQAAITGHLVFATIHTNNAAGAIVRLVNMKVEPFLLASAIKLITAQRLARLNCPACKKEYFPPIELLTRLNIKGKTKFYNSDGCEKCDYKGIKGRIAFHEVLVIDSKIQNLILTNPSDELINESAVKVGMETLRSRALDLVNQGLISLEEALRLTE